MTNEGPSRGLEPKNYELITNKRGGKTLLHVGHSYNWHRNNNLSSVWTCVQKRTIKCSGSIKLEKKSDNVQIQNKHSAECKPNLFKNEVSVIMDKTKSEVKPILNQYKKIMKRM